MKSVWNSFKAAFAMFSKIPTPMVDWNKENMKYMMCFFPFVGTAIGILTWLVGYVLGSHVQMEPFFLAVILTVIPVFVTGGIHVDGLLDTSDALSSWQERTRRLEILKDSHAGAFAIITACVYFILWLGACLYGALPARRALPLPPVWLPAHRAGRAAAGRRGAAKPRIFSGAAAGNFLPISLYRAAQPFG